MNKDIKEIIYTEQQISEMAKRIGEQITKDFAGEEIIMVAVLKGSFMFFADILRNTDLPCRIDFITVQSYGNSTVSGNLELVKDVTVDIEGKNVIIVEDILDSGKTLKFVKELFAQRNPASLKVCTLLDKKGRKTCTVDADYTGFEVDDVFVVGYGLDYAQQYRNLPYIAILKDEIWQ